MEGGVGDYHLDPGFWIGSVAALTRGAQIGHARVLNPGVLPKPDAAEVHVVDWYFLGWVGLGVGANLTPAMLSGLWSGLSMVPVTGMDTLGITMLSTQAVRSRSGGGVSASAWVGDRASF